MMRVLACVVAAATAFVATPSAASATSIDGYLAVDDAASGQIYRLTQLGTDLTQLTHVHGAGRFAFAPRWSPDGRRIAFEMGSNGPFRMYTMGFDGSDVRLVLDDNKNWDDDAASFSADGERILFARCGLRTEGCSIASVKLDGTDLRLLTPRAFDVFDFTPIASPDGTRIAFVRYNANGIHSQIWVMNTDGSDAHPVTRPALEPFAPDWSPDSTTLVMSSHCCRLGGDIYTTDAAGNFLTRLTRTPYPLSSSAGTYAPSGREIAFITNRNYPDRCCSDLFVMRSDGTHQVRVPVDLKFGGDVDWGPSPYSG